MLLSLEFLVDWGDICRNKTAWRTLDEGRSTKWCYAVYKFSRPGSYKCKAPKCRFRSKRNKLKINAGNKIILVEMASVMALSWLTVFVSNDRRTPFSKWGSTCNEIKEQWEVRESTDCTFQCAVLTRSVPNFSNKLKVWVLCPIACTKLRQIQIMPNSCTVKRTHALALHRKRHCSCLASKLRPGWRPGADAFTHHHIVSSLFPALVSCCSAQSVTQDSWSHLWP